MSAKYLTVLSDSHGNTHLIKKLQGDFYSSNYIIHLGDGAFDMQPYYFEFKDKIYQVDGNCDFVKLGLDELILKIEDIKVLIVHGHKFSVKHSLDSLVDYAISKNCNLVLYGHTHIHKIDIIKGVYLVNPGTLSYSPNGQTIARIKIENSTIEPKIIPIYKNF